MATVYDLFSQIQGTGFYEFALPFLLIFTLVFAILEKIKLFGKEARRINVVVALVIGLIFVNQFEIVDRLNLFLPKVSLFIVVAVMFLILVGLFGVNVEGGFSGIILFLFTVASLFIIYWALLPGTDLFGLGGSDFSYWLENNASLLLFLVIIGIIIWAVVGKGGNTSGGKSFLEKFEDVFNKGVGKK